MPTIKLNKFSRNQTDGIDEQLGEITTTKKKGRPSKKAVIKELEQSEPISELDPIMEEEQPEVLEQSDEQEEPVIEEDTFLQEFDNVNYSNDPPKEKEPKPLIFKAPKAPKMTKAIRSMLEDDDSLFDEVGSEIIGRDRREAISKLNQYKNLFPEELKKFKVKKNASLDELKVYLNEMECIVDTSSVENFMTDSILQCIRMVEGASSYSNRYDIRGCADLLKSNKQFHSLCKQLYMKYKIFSKVPAEYQLLMLVSTTAYICNHKNRNKESLETYLNEPI
jgi:hypothetical protein